MKIEFYCNSRFCFFMLHFVVVDCCNKFMCRKFLNFERNMSIATGLVLLTWLWCFWGRLSEIGLLSDYLQTAGGAQQLLNYHVVTIITNYHHRHLHRMALNIQKAICCHLPWPVDSGHSIKASSNTSRRSKVDIRIYF